MTQAISNKMQGTQFCIQYLCKSVANQREKSLHVPELPGEGMRKQTFDTKPQTGDGVT
jgi:hypothetical protein